MAKHSETLEDLVVYQALYTSADYPDGTLWVRPFTMFTGMVTIEGVEQLRFRYLGDV